MTIRRSTLGESLRVADILRLHCRGEDDKSIYKEGWDDRRVAMSIAPDFPISAVARVRTELFGPLHNAPSIKTKKGRPGDRLDALEKIIATIRSDLDALCRELDFKRSAPVSKANGHFADQINFRG
jgi:hypothetical protein